MGQKYVVMQVESERMHVCYLSAPTIQKNPTQIHEPVEAIAAIVFKGVLFPVRPSIFYHSPYMNQVPWELYSEHRELCSNMGMRMQHTIFLMMRLKSFRPEVNKSWQSRRDCQK